MNVTWKVKGCQLQMEKTHKLDFALVTPFGCQKSRTTCEIQCWWEPVLLTTTIYRQTAIKYSETRRLSSTKRNTLWSSYYCSYWVYFWIALSEGVVWGWRRMQCISNNKMPIIKNNNTTLIIHRQLQWTYLLLGLTGLQCFIQSQDQNNLLLFQILAPWHSAVPAVPVEVLQLCEPFFCVRLCLPRRQHLFRPNQVTPSALPGLAEQIAGRLHGWPSAKCHPLASLQQRPGTINM